MKKLLLILLSGIMLFTFFGCESQNEKEITEIEKTLGKVANDYLNAEITKTEAEEKLDMLESRIENVEPDGEYGIRHNAVEVSISLFEFDLVDGEIDNITDIKEKYYD